MTDNASRDGLSSGRSGPETHGPARSEADTACPHPLRSGTSTSDTATLRVGAVSFMNALPLTDALRDDPDVTCVQAVPADLAEMLERGDVDVALVPVIDTVLGDRRWSLVGDGCIACDGATLTVRVFSRVDPADVTTLHVDRDSHTSVALASILWREKYDRVLNLAPFPASGATADELADCQAVLLIGDKVLTPPPGLNAFSTQIDLGATWKSLTGLPFVFAAWATADPAVAERAEPILATARDAGVARAGELAAAHAPRIGWPVDLAKLYLTAYLNFTLDERHRRGMRRFLELARRYDLPSSTGDLVFA